MSEFEKYEGVVLIHEKVKELLPERQQIAYKENRRQYIDWLAYEGKNTDALEGYAIATYKVYENLTCQFHRYVWDQEDHFTLNPTHAHAESFVTKLIRSREYSDTHLHNAKLALKAYFRFKQNEWDTSISIPSSDNAAKPREFLTDEERGKIREAVLEYGSAPAYAALSPQKRTQWKNRLARQFGKPASEITTQDFNRANGYKYPTIVYASLDAGLRPIEVGRAKTYWLNKDNPVISIPYSESSKNTENWTVSLREDTHSFLMSWLEERKLYDKYDDTDQLWLTRHGNPYSSSALQVLLDNLRDIAEIDRSLSWYAIRHSTGTYMAREEGLAAAQSQLRHKRTATTMKYDNVPVEDRQNALERMK